MRKRSHIPIRLNILFSVIVVLFGMLVFRLIDLQVSNGKYFSQLLTKKMALEVKEDVTRGQIFDRNGVLLAGNSTHPTINYTRNTEDTTAMIDTATQLSHLIQVDTSQVSKRDMQDYFFIKNASVVNGRLTASEKELNGGALYQAQLAKITDEDLRYNDQEKEIIAIFSKMNSVSSLSTVAIKNRQVSQQEMDNVKKQLSILSGISIGTDWERHYPEKELLHALLGTVSTNDTGVPAQVANTYVARGYANNARVGTSFLEQQYDAALRGTPKSTAYELNSTYQIVGEKAGFPGKNGSDLYLTIDTKLQRRVEDILASFLLDTSVEKRGYNNSIYAVVQDVTNGEILAISGKKYGYDEKTDSYTRTIEDDVLGAINNNFTVGSVVKAATVGIGYENGVITEENNTMIDEPLYFGSGIPLASSFNANTQIPLNDMMALARSSNIYMARIGMAIGGQKNYENGKQLSLATGTIDKLRKAYASYGLGAYTGIDLPYSSKGYTPTNVTQFNALTLTFGQFDLYTPLQVSQYISTIANGGVRYAPRLGKELRHEKGQDMLGAVQTTLGSKLLNRVNVTASQMQRIQDGLYEVAHHYLGTEFENFGGYGIPVSAKTGTAEAFYSGPIKQYANQPVVNSVSAAYAPSQNPRISVTVIVPYMDGINNYAGKTIRRIMDAYFYQ